MTVGAGVLLVVYPLIDMVASLIDARSQHGSARQLLLVNAAVSAVAAVALGVAATGTVADVFAVFGTWALLTGAAQLVVALRRRALLGNQWPLLLANGVSVIGGVAWLASNHMSSCPDRGGSRSTASVDAPRAMARRWLDAGAGAWDTHGGSM